MMRTVLIAATMIAAAPWAAKADTETLCTLVASANGTVLVERGDRCGERVTPASTFKVALAVMGYEAGFLQDEANPVLPFMPGYPDWIGAWKQSTGPAAWMKNSVVWYSQRITEQLGTQRLTDHARAFGHGNADFSGDPGKGNGLERAWIGSSLTISPREQVAFIGRLMNETLPVAPQAVRKTIAIIERREAGGWTVRGKTGSAYPRNADGSFDRARMFGWYVGWAERDGRRLVFAHLRQDRTRQKGPGGLRARDDFLALWPDLAGEAVETR